MAFTPKIYGTNIEISGGETPDRVTLLAEATDLVTFELESEGLYPDIQLGEAKSYGGKKYGSKEITLKWSLKTIPFVFPADNISIWDYYAIPFFKKEFHYLDVADFPIFTDQYNQDLIHRVVLMSVKPEHMNSIGAKTLTVEIEKGETV